MKNELALLNPKYNTDILSLVHCILPEIEMGYTFINQIEFTSTQGLTAIPSLMITSFRLFWLLCFKFVLSYRCSVYYIHSSPDTEEE